MDVITTINGIDYTEVPLGYSEGIFVWEKEEGQIFFRKKLQANLVYTGLAFQAAKALVIAGDCQEMDILADGWEGYFTIADGTFNFSRNTFTVTPKPRDIYDEIMRQGNIKYNIMDMSIAVSVQPDAGSPIYENCRTLEDTIQGMLNEMGAYTYASTFFQDANNPVTEVINRYRYLHIAQKSDIKRPLSTEPVRFAEMSFLDLMSILNKMFNVYWDIEGGAPYNVLIIEHLTYFESLEEQVLKDELSTMEFNFDIDKKFGIERWEMMEGAEGDADNIDFRNISIIYNSECVNNEEFLRSVPITTDIEMIQENTELIADEGYVIFACNTASGNNRPVYPATSPLQPVAALNLDLGWANLIDRFWRYGRIERDSNLSGEFFTIKEDKIQNLPYKVCKGVDEKKLVETYLGDELGLRGRIMRIEESVKSGAGLVLIGYGYTTIVPPPPDQIIYMSFLNPDTINGNLTHEAPLGMFVEVTWTIYDSLFVPIESGVDTWNILELAIATQFIIPFSVPPNPGDTLSVEFTDITAGWTAEPFGLIEIIV